MATATTPVNFKELGLIPPLLTQLTELGYQQSTPIQAQAIPIVLTGRDLMAGSKEEEEASFRSGEGGELQPIMCTDKELGDLGTFADLVAESDKMEQNWQIVLVASLSGKNSTVPNSIDAEKPLKMMVDTVQTEGDLSKIHGLRQRRHANSI